MIALKVAGCAMMLAASLLIAQGAQAQNAVPRVPSSHVPMLQLPGEQPVKLYSNSYALVIGASNYTNGWPRLPGVLTDIQAVEAALVGHGFTVTVVTDPTRAQMDEAMRKFVSDFGEVSDNRLIIYFAGHGHTIKFDDGRQLGYIVPVDAPSPQASKNNGAFKAAAFGMEYLESHAKQIAAKHALFLFDSCFSGTFFKMRAVPEIISLKTTLPVRQFITAGDADQKVPDVSIFREQLVEALNGAGDLNNDGYVTASELGQFLESQVHNYSKGTQTPQYGKIQDSKLDKGDFVFALPIVEAPIGGDLNLEDLRKRNTARKQWEQWQAKMSAAYDEVNRFDGSAALKVEAWARFLASYAQDNPFSAEDEQLRAQATQKRDEEASREAELRPGKIIRDCADCPEMVVISGGRFTMGSPTDEKGRDSDEGPQHQVRIATFALGKTEVTFAQWDACVAGGGCSHRPEDEGWGRSNRPVINVSWKDAQEYVKWLSGKTGKTYRLPSEAEWEYAARAGSTTARHWGNNPDEACRYANVYDATGKRVSSYGWEAHNCDDREAKTAPVSNYVANAFGLHDMIGNVWEWVEDCWNKNYEGAPKDGSAWTSGDCTVRGLRGGSWDFDPDFARSASRLRYDASVRVNYIGFRLARMLP